MNDKPTEPGPNSKTTTLIVAAVVGLALVVAIVLASREESAQLHDPKVQLEQAEAALRAGANDAARKILEPLASNGDLQAQYWLGVIYEEGLGVDKDISRAIALFEQAANGGVQPAWAKLGLIYFQGDETVQDFGKAAKWLKMAALDGNGRSAVYLGNIHASGLGVPKDVSEAYAWYETGALLKDDYGETLRNQLLESMTPEEIAKGETRAQTLSAELRPPPAAKLKPPAQPEIPAKTH